MPTEGERQPEAGRRWFYLLPESHLASRYVFAARLAEKASLEGHRVCLFCDDQEQAEEVDQALWAFRPDSFVPHEVVETAAAPVAPVGITWSQPAPQDWETLIILSTRLPAQADLFRRLALVAHDDPTTLDRARSLYRQLRELGCTPQVHDTRRQKRQR